MRFETGPEMEEYSLTGFVLVSEAWGLRTLGSPFSFSLVTHSEYYLELSAVHGTVFAGKTGGKTIWVHSVDEGVVFLKGFKLADDLGQELGI